jgi:hypothetical protein
VSVVKWPLRRRSQIRSSDSVEIRRFCLVRTRQVLHEVLFSVPIVLVDGGPPSVNVLLHRAPPP